MEITFLGHSSFRIKGKSASLITDPYDSSIGFKFPKVSADIVTISHDHSDHNKSDQVSDVHMAIDGPGEYEVKGVSIVGFTTYHDNKKGELRGKNTVYIYEVDGLRLVHLGDLGQKMSGKEQEMLGDVDVLMIPVGGEYTIGPHEAGEVARGIEANIILPMHYQVPGLDQKTFGKLANTDHFCSDLGLPVEKLSKLQIKKESLGEEQKVVILEKR